MPDENDLNEVNKSFNADPPPDDPPLNPGWYTLSQLAAEFKYSPGTLRNLCQEGTVKCYNLDNRLWVIFKPSFEAYREARGGKPHLKNE